MQHLQTQQEQEDGLNIQSSDETGSSKNYPLLTREQLPETPFWVVGSDEIGWKLTWGKYTFNDQPLEKKEMINSWYITHMWDIVLHLIAIGISNSYRKDKISPE